MFVATQTNEVAAFDAMTGATLWSVNLGTPVPPANLPCTQPLNQTYGIQSTPAIDEASRTLFTDAFVTVGDDGATEKHLVFALSIDDGSIRAGWPVDVAAAVDGFSAIVQHQRGSLLVLNGMVYITYSGIEYDCEPPTYHGRVIGISMADPTHVISWAVPANRGGIWGAVASDGTSLFVSTGNTYTPGGIPDAGQTWGGGEAVIRLTQDSVFTGDTTSFFTPSNWQTLDMRDYDLGSSSPVLLDVPGANPSSLIVAMGKAGVAHLLDRSNLGGIGTGNGSTGEGLFSAALVLPAEGMKGNPAAYTTAQGQYVVFRGDAVATGCPGDASAGDLVALTSSPDLAPVVLRRLVRNVTGSRLAHGDHDRWPVEPDSVGRKCPGLEPPPRLRRRHGRGGLHRRRRDDDAGSPLDEPDRREGSVLRRRHGAAVRFRRTVERYGVVA